MILLKPDDKNNYKETYSPEYTSYFNDKEGDKIVSFLKALLLKWPEAEWGQLKDYPNSIGILTTEYAQVKHMIINKYANGFINSADTLYPQLFEGRTHAEHLCGHNCKCTRYIHTSI